VHLKSIIRVLNSVHSLMRSALCRLCILTILSASQTSAAPSCPASQAFKGISLLQTGRLRQSIFDSSIQTTPMVSVALSWETGTVDSGLAAPLKPSFSKNKNSWTPPKDPQGEDCKKGRVSKQKLLASVYWEKICWRQTPLPLS